VLACALDINLRPCSSVGRASVSYDITISNLKVVGSSVSATPPGASFCRKLPVMAVVFKHTEPSRRTVNSAKRSPCVSLLRCKLWTVTRKCSSPCRQADAPDEPAQYGLCAVASYAYICRFQYTSMAFGSQELYPEDNGGPPFNFFLLELVAGVLQKNRGTLCLALVDGGHLCAPFFREGKCQWTSAGVCVK